MASPGSQMATTELRAVQTHIEEVQKMARERYVPILYGRRVIGTGKADIVVIPTEGLSVPIECKKTLLKEDDRQQLRTYMKGMGNECAHGILIRFPQPGAHKSDAIAPPEFYWARKDREGNVEFYRRENDAWVPDENKQKRKPKAKASAQDSST
jgi:hypothetical protein